MREITDGNLGAALAYQPFLLTETKGRINMTLSRLETPLYFATW